MGRPVFGLCGVWTVWLREIRETSNRLARVVSEMRIDYGPGYRVYFVQRGTMLVLLLCGGDKKTQDQDIRFAKALARNWREKLPN